MKKKFLQLVCLLCLLLTVIIPAKAQSIYTYSNATNGAYASLAANLTASTLATVGSWGSNTPCSNGGGISGITVNPSFATFNPANASSPALNVNITPNTGYMIKVTSMSVSMRRSGTGPTKARLAYSIDGGTTWFNNGTDYAPNNNSCGSFSSGSWTLSTPLYVCSGMLKVRIYYFAAGASTGTCQTANLVVNGTVTPLPVPSLTISSSTSVPPLCAGTNITFTAAPVNPGTAPTYTWKKNGSTVGANSNIYSDNTLTGSDVITCEMNSNAPCASTAAVSSNAVSVLIIPAITSNVADTICYGESLAWGTQTLNATGTYSQVFTSAQGCDSTVTMNLFVRPEITHAFADTACFGDSYTWASQTLNTTGTYFQTFPSYTGCDSIVTFHLFVRPEITHVFADTACYGATYNWQSLALTATGVYSQTFPSYTGCDSNVTLHLFVRPAITKTFADTICALATYTWAGQSFTTTGTYNHTFTSYTSCDSVVTLNLFVRPAITKTFADTICALATYNWAGQSFTTTGTYNHTFTSYTNCDSTVTLHLFVRPAITKTFADTICALATYNWAGQSFTTTGTYNHTFTSYTSCDSTVTLHLFVRPAITKTFADTICALATYTWAGQSFTTTGTYNHTFTSYTSCDSTVTLHLFVRPAITKTFADTICALATYNWAGQSFTTTGIYNHTFTSYTNCDSTVTLHLFVRPAITKTFADTICASATYSWAGQSFTTTGTYNHTFTSYTSCDSTVTLHLFVRPAITKTFADTICALATYNWAGQSFTTTGTYNHTFISYTNCDSVVTLHLYVYPLISNTVNATICNGSTYLFGTQVISVAGTYNHAFQAMNGCDSNVTLILNVTPVITNTISDTICYGASYNWGAQVYTASGSYNQTFTASTSCDSIVTLNLTVSPLISNTINDTICYGTTYTLGTQVLNASGTYNATFTAATGCDSILTLYLTVSPQVVTNISNAICYGQTYTLGSQALTTTGNYTEIFTSADGCDSTVHLNLYVSPQPPTTIIDTASCGSLFFEGTLYTSTTTLTDTFHTSLGCDSLYRIVNIVINNNTPLVQTIDTMGCNSLVFEGTVYTTSTSFTDTLRNTLGCDSLVRNINIIIGTSGTYNLDREICEGDTFHFDGQHYTTTGTYAFTFKNKAGCDSLINIMLKVNPLPNVQLTEAEVLNHCIGDSVLLLESGASAFNLVTGFGEQDNNALHALLIDPKNTIAIEGIDAKGCRDTASIVIDAQHCCDIWLPNAFSPNGDGLNDEFIPKTKGHPKEYVMHIFDRWGQNIFTSFDIEKGWDGTINGKPAAISTYHYFISGKCTNGEPVNLKGGITLVR
ncbi:gliding motility-associated C-terminal domain-containing protein [Taibaiella lutea]|uniref:Gliding motility-associated C-terminal domain-containing protein n=1 Tax=Taibaiella lutea TaxID=2608001 RepID=A0A5M6CH34_9BACT|nr:T9SS type B sorting domain-containing protein [Taibaiella lutea]KAA5534538.1 gliding motility-associated C-terminal domain-containing protein [Taibaiella lutea]